MPSFDQYQDFRTGRVLGHYMTFQRSGELAATIAAGAHLARIRWADTTGAKCVVQRIRVGWSVSAAITAAVEMTLRAMIVRAFSVDFTTNMTQVSMAAPANTGEMRNEMQGSLMGVAGPGIATTAAMSGQTLTADSAAAAGVVFENQPSGNATVTQAVGVAGSMRTLYDRTTAGQHPILLNSNEGVVIQTHLAGPASGTWALYTEWTWAEVLAF